MLPVSRKGTSQPPPNPIQQLTEQPISILRLQIPHKARDLYDKARKALGKHQYGDALIRLNQAVRDYPSFPEALAMLGYVQICLSQWGTAEQSLQAALRTDPKYGLAHLVLADLYNTIERFDDALVSAQKAGALIPNAWVVQFEMARALLGNGQYDSALRISDTALRKNPGTLLRVLKAHALIGLAGISYYQPRTISLSEGRKNGIWQVSHIGDHREIPIQELFRLSNTG